MCIHCALDITCNRCFLNIGVTSHYITDINWHGLEVIPDGEGIIRTMGYADFNCTDGSLCSVAHTAADTGGEFVAAATMDVSWFPAVSTRFMTRL